MGEGRFLQEFLCQVPEGGGAFCFKQAPPGPRLETDVLKGQRKESRGKTGKGKEERNRAEHKENQEGANPKMTAGKEEERKGQGFGRREKRGK